MGAKNFTNAKPLSDSDIIDFPPIVVTPPPDQIILPVIPPEQNIAPAPPPASNGEITGFKGPFNGGGNTIVIDPSKPAPSLKEALIAFTPGGENFWRAAQAGDSALALNFFCNGLIGFASPICAMGFGIWGNFNRQQLSGKYLPAGTQPGAMDLPIVDLPNLTNMASVFVLQGIYGRTSLFTESPDPPQGYDFWGTSLMPISAVNYWLFGNGQDRHLNIESLGLNPQYSDFIPIIQALSNPNNQAGTYAIDGKFSFNSFSTGIKGVWAAGTLGRISGNVKGALTIGDGGDWSFNGKYSIEKDKFDADASNRPLIQESLTTFLRNLGDTHGHTDYFIYIDGEKEVNFSGHK